MAYSRPRFTPISSGFEFDSATTVHQTSGPLDVGNGSHTGGSSRFHSRTVSSIYRFKTAIFSTISFLAGTAITLYTALGRS